MRRLFSVLVVFLVCASAATGVRLHALSECERWIAEYRDALAHSPTMQRAKAAKHRLHHYVHKTAAKPKPRVLSARYMRPKYTKEELLNRMQFACSDIPTNDPTLDMVADNAPPTFLPADDSQVSPMAARPDTTDAGYPLGTGVPLAPTTTSSRGGGTPGGGGGGGGYPGGGYPGGGYPGGGGGNPGGGNPGGGDNPGGGNPGGPDTPPPPPPPTAVAPEPGSLLLLATGLAGAARVVRRRINR